MLPKRMKLNWSLLQLSYVYHKVCRLNKSVPNPADVQALRPSS